MAGGDDEPMERLEIRKDEPNGLLSVARHQKLPKSLVLLHESVESRGKGQELVTESLRIETGYYNEY
jgi:hypothetical protein